MNIYCTKCGAKHEYASAAAKPNFCSKCGNPFAGNTPVAVQPKQTVHEEVAEEVPQDIPTIESPKFSVSVENTKISIEELRKRSTVVAGVGRARGNVSEADLKKYMQDLHAKDVEESKIDPSQHGK